MVGIRQYLRPEIAASAIAHLSIVALVFVYAEAHPFVSAPTQSVNVDIVTPDEIEKKPEPTPSASPKPATDLSALTKPAEPQAPLPAAQPASPPPKQATRPNRKEAAVAPKPEASPAQSQPQPPPQAQAAPQPVPAQPVPPQPAPAQAATAAPLTGYALPQPDLTVKYNVALGLPEALPPSILSADVGDKKGDGGDAATKADVGGDMVATFRSRIRQCSKLPSSLSPSDDLFIKLRILMTPDGRLAAAPMVKEGTASLKAVDLRDGAVAALSACQPYTMLPREKYQEWKVIDLTFTPHDFNS